MNQKNISDQQLIAELIAGNNTYFGIFSERYRGFILTKCHQFVKSEDEAEDLCQEVMIKVFLQIRTFRQEARFNTWLYTVIYNTCVDHLRKSKQNVNKILSANLHQHMEEIVDFDEKPTKEVSMEMLEELLNQMTPEGRLILLLKYKENRSLKEIMSTLGISESAAKMRLLRAKTILSHLLDHYDHPS